MNIVKSFVTYMESLGIGTFGTDIFIGSSPLQAPDPCWWVLAGGGAAISKNQTGEKRKNYLISVFYRSMDAEDVYNTLQNFEELINTANCDQLDGYDTIEMEATSFPADQDLDLEDRTVGLVQVTVTTYK